MATPTLAELMVEYERALAHTDELRSGLTPEQVAWRPDEDASAIGWHLGHQPAVAHFMVRNLTAAEPLVDPELDSLMDSATPEPDRGALPDLGRLLDYRGTVAERVRFRIGQIDEGRVGAPAQLRLVAGNLLTAVINHEYQHDQWIGEVRSDAHGLDLPERPTSPWLTTVDGYLVVGPT
ncbi:MAG: DinB family protein [Actinomycetota bacterium]